MTDIDTSEIKEELEEIEQDIFRIIYLWRRYKCKRHKDTEGKFYDFNDIDLLTENIKEYFKNPENFDRDYGRMEY